MINKDWDPVEERWSMVNDRLRFIGKYQLSPEFCKQPSKQIIIWNVASWEKGKYIALGETTPMYALDFV